MTVKTPHKFKIGLNSPVVLGFTAICLLSQLLRLILPAQTYSAIFSVYRSDFSLLWIMRLFTHVFGHSSWEHLIGNMMYFLVLGPMLEEKYGSLRLIVIIAVAAVVTGLFNLLFFAGTSTLGASGVVFAFILLSSITMREGGTIPLTFLLVALLYIGQQLLQVFQKDNISQLSHIVGGAVGTVAGFMLSSGKKKGA
ncbi:MAG: rhomboid family intramembrane serine protease [Clostridia bacterium]|nr:rhomboid family intramembrane serine protease [Clostridia bacterium]